MNLINATKILCPIAERFNRNREHITTTLPDSTMIDFFRGNF